MDFLSLIILVGAVGCFIVIAFYIRLGRRVDEDSQETIPEEKEAVIPMKEEANGPGQTAKGYHALHIPPGMLGDERNADIRGQVEKAIQGFQWNEDGDGHAFLYTFTKEKSGWVCPYCEGENREEDPICMICGRSRAQEEDMQEEFAQEEPVQEEFAQEETAQEDSVQEEPAQEDSVQEEFAQEEPVQEEFAQEEPAQEETAQEETAQEDFLQELSAGTESAQEDFLQELSAREKSAQDEAVRNQAVPGKTAQEEIAQE